MIEAKCTAAPRGLSCCRRAGHAGHCWTFERAAPVHGKLADLAELLLDLSRKAERIVDVRHYEDLDDEGADIARGIRAAFRESTFNG